MHLLELHLLSSGGTLSADRPVVDENVANVLPSILAQTGFSCQREGCCRLDSRAGIERLAAVSVGTQRSERLASTVGLELETAPLTRRRRLHKHM